MAGRFRVCSQDRSTRFVIMSVITEAELSRDAKSSVGNWISSGPGAPDGGRLLPCDTDDDRNQRSVGGILTRSSRRSCILSACHIRTARNHNDTINNNTKNYSPTFADLHPVFTAVGVETTAIGHGFGKISTSLCSR